MVLLASGKRVQVFICCPYCLATTKLNSGVLFVLAARILNCVPFKVKDKFCFKTSFHLRGNLAQASSKVSCYTVGRLTCHPASCRDKEKNL